MERRGDQRVWAQRGIWRVLLVSALLVSATVQTHDQPQASTISVPPTTVLDTVSTPRIISVALTTPPSTTTTAVPVTPTTAPPWTEGNSGPFAIAPGASLPTDAECAARVVKTAENRSANAAANATTGAAGAATYRNWGTNATAVAYAKRVSGNYKGTTDEIVQWASCKWGFDPEPVRAQVMIESSWRQGAYGGFVPDNGKCTDPKLRRATPATTTTTTPAPAAPTTTTTAVVGPPLLAGDQPPVDASTDGTQPFPTPSTTALPAPFECPTAFGLMQLRSDYQPGSYPMSARSTAFNLDYSLAMKRACYDGVGWLGVQTKGNAWGCVGVHYSGKWLDDPAKAYIAKVQAAMGKKAWLRF